MSNDTAPQAPRTLFPSAAAASPSTRPATRTESAPTAQRFSAPVRLEAPRQATPMTPSRVSTPEAAQPAAQPTVTRAAPMYQELKRPLSELVSRRSATDFKQLFTELVGHGVSDVHMTRSAIDKTFTVEARVDGKKQLVHSYSGAEAQTIATLIKTDAKMTTGATIVPEDGSYSMPIEGYPYRARAVSLPLFDGGERIVFRLPQVGELRSLEQLGFTYDNLVALKELLSIPGGMTIFAGPTGEGKSTTALSSLKYLREQEDGVFITLEDPVERVIHGVAQIEVKEEVEGAGFGEMMKFLVRADANVLFLGEIRDAATATAAVEIAKSGRRVIATMHSKDNIGALLRLMKMADDTPLSILESVNGIVSQRLVPRLVEGTDRFAGRYPIHEVTTNSEELTDALVANVSRATIRAASEATSTTFKANVDELIAAGITTYAEVRKVVRNV